MIRLILISFILLLVNFRAVQAQELKPAQGKVEVVQDEKISKLATQYQQVSKEKPEIDGFRVQIFFDSGTNSKNKAASIKNEFEVAYPGMKSYLSYKEPYYRVRIGDFRTLTEAVGFQKKIAGTYPNSFPVKDKIVL